MSRRMGSFHPLLSIVLALSILLDHSSCTSATPSDSLLQSDDASQVLTEDPQIGISIGNPTKPKMSVTFALAEAKTPIGTEENHPDVFSCEPPQDGMRTMPVCSFTPTRLTLAIAALYFVECLDPTGMPVACASPEAVTVGGKSAIFEGDPIVTQINTLGANFSDALSTPEETLTAGGLQIVTSFLEVKFPADGQGGAGHVVGPLRDKDVRVCTAADEDAGALCGNADALRGDYLIAPPGAMPDSQLNFMSFVSADSPDAMSPSTRPENYEAQFDYNPYHLGEASWLGWDTDPNPEFTDGSDFAAGYFAPIVPFDKTIAVGPETGTTVSIVLDLARTLSFAEHDAPIPAPNDSPNLPPTPDSKPPLSPGNAPPPPEKPAQNVLSGMNPVVYNPLVDGAFRFEAPYSTVTVE